VVDYRLVDRDRVTTTSLNRLKTATPADIGKTKVDVARTMIEAIQPDGTVTAIQKWIADAPEAIEQADVVFGCLDKDIHRVELIKLCTAAGVQFFDLATDVDDHHGPLTYGIYGVDKADLDEPGPSVVYLNGVIASIAVMEFMVWVTGLRAPQPLLTYRAERGIVRQSIDAPREGCPYCSEARRKAA
jgi:hypothetical protein